MIHRIEEGVYVISAHNVWRPGAYDSKATARKAIRRKDAELAVLQSSKKVGCVITSEDLKKTYIRERGSFYYGE